MRQVLLYLQGARNQLFAEVNSLFIPKRPGNDPFYPLNDGGFNNANFCRKK